MRSNFIDLCGYAGSVINPISRKDCHSAMIIIKGGSGAVKLLHAESENGQFIEYKTLIENADEETVKSVFVLLDGAKEFIKVTGTSNADIVFGDCDFDPKLIEVAKGESGVPVDFYAYDLEYYAAFSDKAELQANDTVFVCNYSQTNLTYQNFLGDGAEGGALTNKYKCEYTGHLTRPNIVNLQKRNEKAGIYISFASEVVSCDITEDESGYAIEGAGIWVFVENFKNRLTEFNVYTGNPANPDVYSFRVYYADGELDFNFYDINTRLTMFSYSGTLKAARMYTDNNRYNVSRSTENDYREYINAIDTVEHSGGLDVAPLGKAVKIADGKKEYKLYAWEVSISSGSYGYVENEDVQVGDLFFLPEYTGRGQITSVSELKKVYTVKEVQDGSHIVVNEGTAGDIIFVRKPEGDYVEEILDIQPVTVKDSGLVTADNGAVFKMVKTQTKLLCYGYMGTYLYVPKAEIGAKVYGVSGSNIIIKGTVSAVYGYGSQIEFERNTYSKSAAYDIVLE